MAELLAERANDISAQPTATSLANRCQTPLNVQEQRLLQSATPKAAVMSQRVHQLTQLQMLAGKDLAEITESVREMEEKWDELLLERRKMHEEYEPRLAQLRANKQKIEKLTRIRASQCTRATAAAEETCPGWMISHV
jgi:hypothetical protein